MKIRLSDQVAELVRIHRERERRRVYRMPSPAERSHEIVLERRQACLNAAIVTLAWLDRHLAVFRGYVKWVTPFVAQSDDWDEAPHIAELEVAPHREAAKQAPINPRVAVTPWRELPDGTRQRLASSDAGLLAEVPAT
jgi:hypothetical protein